MPKVEVHAKLYCHQQLHLNGSLDVVVPNESQQDGHGSMHNGRYHSSLATQQDHDKKGQHGVLDCSVLHNMPVHTRPCASDADAAPVQPVYYVRVCYCSLAHF